MKAIFNIFIYSLIIIICYMMINFSPTRLACSNNYVKKNRNLTVCRILIISLLFTLYNVFVTNGQLPTGGDRLNYYIDFLGYRENESIALSFIFDFVKRINGSIFTVYYITTFICCCLNFLAYSKFSLANKKVALLFLLTDAVLYSFTALKQCYAFAFSALLFANLLDNKESNDIINIIYIVLACLFHTSGYILIPLFITIKIVKKHPSALYISVFAVFFVFVFFQPILLYFASLLKNVLPVLSKKIMNYFGDSMPEGGRSIQIIKWIPFYFITFLGFYYRKSLRSKIVNYDLFLIISIISSGLALFSFFNYWFYRFLPLFYLPNFTFFVLINEKVSDKSNRLLNYIIVYGGVALVFYRWLFLIFINYGGF